MTFIMVKQVGTSPSGKTNIFEVYTIDGTMLLGRISWYAQWRRYAFFPSADCVFESICLREIASFLNEQTIAQNFSRKGMTSGR